MTDCRDTDATNDLDAFQSPARLAVYRPAAGGYTEHLTRSVRDTGQLFCPKRRRTKQHQQQQPSPSEQATVAVAYDRVDRSERSTGTVSSAELERQRESAIRDAYVALQLDALNMDFDSDGDGDNGDFVESTVGASIVVRTPTLLTEDDPLPSEPSSSPPAPQTSPSALAAETTTPTHEAIQQAGTLSDTSPPPSYQYSDDGCELALLPDSQALDLLMELESEMLQQAEQPAKESTCATLADTSVDAVDAHTLVDAADPGRDTYSLALLDNNNDNDEEDDDESMSPSMVLDPTPSFTSLLDQATLASSHAQMVEVPDYLDPTLDVDYCACPICDGDITELSGREREVHADRCAARLLDAPANAASAPSPVSTHAPLDFTSNRARQDEAVMLILDTMSCCPCCRFFWPASARTGLRRLQHVKSCTQRTRIPFHTLIDTLKAKHQSTAPTPADPPNDPSSTATITNTVKEKCRTVNFIATAEDDAFAPVLHTYRPSDPASGRRAATANAVTRQELLGDVELQTALALSASLKPDKKRGLQRKQTQRLASDILSVDDALVIVRQRAELLLADSLYSAPADTFTTPIWSDNSARPLLWQIASGELPSDSPYYHLSIFAQQQHTQPSSDKRKVAAED